MPEPRRISDASRSASRLLNVQVRDARLNAVLIAFAAVFGICLVLCVKVVATGTGGYRFGDFYALWCSATLAHDGSATANYDATALHLHQVALGMHADGYNPFPYPPTFLLFLAPLGALSLGAAYVLFMGATFAGYIAAIAGGRWRDWPYLLGAVIAPATGVTLISGQSGFLSGGLMLGALRLTASRPAAAGVLFGMLAYKPQLAVLVPVLLLAARLWRTAAAAAMTAVICAVVSSAAFGFGIWPAWLASLHAYSGRYEPLARLMPTIAANARMLGASASSALAIQACVAVAVAVVVWRAFRGGVTPRASALLVAGTFLATPHAFNYDLPMTTAAALWYLLERLRATRALSLLEIAVLGSALALPVAMATLGQDSPPISWAPELALFCLVAGADFRRALTVAPRRVSLEPSPQVGPAEDGSPQRLGGHPPYASEASRRLPV